MTFCETGKKKGLSIYYVIGDGWGGAVFPIYYNITRGRGGSLGTPNLYYVIYGRPLLQYYGDYKINIALVVSSLIDINLPCFFIWGRMSITNAPKLAISQKYKIENILMAKL